MDGRAAASSSREDEAGDPQKCSCWRDLSTESTIRSSYSKPPTGPSGFLSRSIVCKKYVRPHSLFISFITSSSWRFVLPPFPSPSSSSRAERCTEDVAYPQCLISPSWTLALVTVNPTRSVSRAAHWLVQVLKARGGKTCSCVCLGHVPVVDAERAKKLRSWRERKS